MSYTQIHYLTQKIQCKLQVLQPLPVDGVNFGEFGSERCFLQEKQSANRSQQTEKELGQALKSLASGDRRQLLAPACLEFYYSLIRWRENWISSQKSKPQWTEWVSI